MSDSVPDESLRRAALGMLDDGNSAESVAHVLAVPLDIVRGWRAARPAPRQVARVAPPAPDTPAPRIRFETTLEYSTPKALRIGNLILGIAMAGVFLAILFYVAATFAGNALVDVACEGFMALSGCFTACYLIQLSRVALVLGTDAVIVPTLFGSTVLPYADVAGHTIKAGTLVQMDSPQQGEWLKIWSRDADVAPIEVFIYDRYPLDLQVLARLDEIARANAPALTLARRS